ncbi:MAG: S46 family peptidase [Prevotellaceae bacterium]|jgi:hypothetical protein|nr:S46 family peptidase [Prevotellaceae bacterium]
MKHYMICFLCGALLMSGKPAWADEGMWLLPLVEKLNYAEMKQKGLMLTAEDIYSINRSSLKDAVVIFGGGCTGEIISDEGLLLTNHHCGYGFIQQHSSVEHDYLKDGFWAMTRDDEIPTAGLTVTFLDHIEDVTAQILASHGMDTLDETARAAHIKTRQKSLTDSATAGRSGISAQVYSMFEGNAYYLFTYKKYEDVRFVGAPPSSVGKFGADTDNWMWPRHTGDFSMFRVYADSLGNPAKYSPHNVPLTPKHHLKVSIAGYEKGDYAMIMGYPGSTNRYAASWEIKERMMTNDVRIEVRGVRQEILLKDMLADPKIKIQYASKYSGSTNYWKNSIGMNRGIKRLHVIERKEAIEKDFAAFAAASGNENYSTAMDDIRQAVESRAALRNVWQYHAEIFRSIEIHGMAAQAIPYLQALQENDAVRIAEAKTALLNAAENFYKNYHAPTDVKVTKAMLRLFAGKVDKRYFPQPLAEAEKKYKGNFDAYVDNLFAASAFASIDKLKAWLDKPSLKKLRNDPALQLALSQKKIADDIATTFLADKRQARGSRHFMAGLMAMDSTKTFYPDANFSTRLTYGQVLDYYPADAVHYEYYTTLQGVMEKEDAANWEFVVPEKLKQRYAQKDFGRYAMPDGSMPVCFLTNNDITGGNSGSPVLNSRGELIGIAFDGNWEAMSGDIVFEPALQRCINVDIRYVLFIIDKYAGATHLIRELTIAEDEGERN